ncbi:MAG: M13 family metallopeptidase, partial [Candidatus Marinimicrobia bacterium]|nr:M13 family metallopeptidase [Candidatus Neomarinimicrobiota bacterium]
VRPQDDIYQYVNGTWLANTEIPADKSNYGSFTELRDMSDERLKSIIDAASTGEEEQSEEMLKVGAFYRSYMNTDLIEELGITPLAGELSKIQSVSSYDDLLDLFVQIQKKGVKTPIGISVSQDSKETTRYILYANQSGLGLPDRDYYLKEGERFDTIREKYEEHIANIFTLAGIDDAKSKAERVMEIETGLAEHQWTRVENRDRDKTYNKYDLAGLNELTPNFDWKAFYAGIGVAETQEVVVRQPSYLEGFNKKWKEVSVDDWKVYFTWHLYDAFAAELNADFVDANFDMYSKTLNGIEENLPRWKRGVSAVDLILGEAVGKIYVQKHFTPAAKERMVELVHNLEAAMEERLKGLEWMGEETKAQALIKLSKFSSKIGYPDVWKDYSDLEIKEDDLIGNYLRYNKFVDDKAMAKLPGPIDRNEWFMNPQTVNAYYNPSMNEVVFPAAILQPPFFNMQADDAVNYGGIGAVIGHELSHGYDDQGRKSDGDGNLKEWWTEEDEKKFNERAQVMIDQFSAFSPLDSVYLNGELTLGENIGDMAGLTVAYRAYKNSLNGKEAPLIDGLTGDQRFFIGWAQVWRRNMREKALRQRILTDPHSPGNYRVTGALQNMPEFYEAFDVKEGDKMFIPVEKRVKIW